jgi:hypothetical protein
MRRCTQSASPATRLQKTVTTFSLATHLRPDLNDAPILGGINFFKTRNDGSGLCGALLLGASLEPLQRRWRLRSGCHQRLPPGENYQAPRSRAERAYHKLFYFNKIDQGGHYAAWEQPQLFSE